MTENTYEAIVIGGGPGGYVAAIRLGQLGPKTLLVEKEHLGGVCLNWGCIPSKALVTVSGVMDKIRRADTMGIAVSEPRIDLGKMQEWKNGIVKQLTSGVRDLLKSNGVNVIMGTARLTGPQSVSVTSAAGETKTYLATKAIILAAGARPAELPGFETDGKVVITAREALSLVKMPKRLLIVGGGAIGFEIGAAYQKLGAKVIVVEMTKQILPGLDSDLAAVVQRRFEKAGGEVLLGTKAASVRVKGEEAAVTVNHLGESREIIADHVLVASGFRPNSEKLGLERLSIETDSAGHVRVDQHLRTNLPNIYAIGDLCGAPYLAHKASREGEIAAEIIAGMKSECDWRSVAAAYFTDPEVGVVGVSEAQARKENLAIKVGKFPFTASGRARTSGETDGFIKTVVDAEQNYLLGVGIVGANATDLIGEAALGVEMCASAEDVAATIHPHPTLCEALMESCKNSAGEAIHVLTGDDDQRPQARRI